MAGLETVYAIHHFEAENPDEIAFAVGEPIIVLEKDDGYNDGWWQVRLLYYKKARHSRVLTSSFNDRDAMSKERSACSP